MKQVQRGFTLIELVMVIVILGVLAAVALPKFVDLRTEADAAATQGVAGAVGSASAINYAAKSVGTTGKGTTTFGLACQAAAQAILEGGVPAGYNLTGPATLAAGSNNCLVTSAKGATATAVILGIN